MGKDRFFAASIPDGEDVRTFYVHYSGEWAVRQVEQAGGRWEWATEGRQSSNEIFLADQPLSDSDLDIAVEIDREDFENAWDAAKGPRWEE